MLFLRLANLRPRIHSGALIAAIALSAGPTLPAYAIDSTDYSVVGQWKLTAALDPAKIASRDEREAQQLVGHTLRISKKELQFDKRVCSMPDFEAERVEPRLYLRERYHADGARLGLPNPVTVVHLDCTSAFVKNPNHLVVFWDGWFFDAVRIKR
jgi:hypothetical protein